MTSGYARPPAISPRASLPTCPPGSRETQRPIKRPLASMQGCYFSRSKRRRQSEQSRQKYTATSLPAHKQLYPPQSKGANRLSVQSPPPHPQNQSPQPSPNP